MAGALSKHAVWLILALALALRLRYVEFTPDYALGNDGRDYDRQAVSIAIGEGYPSGQGAGSRDRLPAAGYPSCSRASAT